ncbi:hypothetical protein [Leifsonia sp. P73]|uniref:hypothetical protein n=1 Tax=Leifsonia sp. P73 TaxID=3423959 RepID=UPI003DA2BE32
MTAITGIAAFVLSLLVSYRLFAPGVFIERLIFIGVITTIASIIAHSIEKRRLVERQQNEEKERRAQELERRNRKRAAKARKARQRQEAQDREAQLRRDRWQAAQAHVAHVREAQQRVWDLDSGHAGPYAFGAVADAALADIVWKALGVPAEERVAISPKQLASLTGTLVVIGHVTDLEGLQHATNLEVLAVGADIDSLDPLAGLRQLTALTLYGLPRVSDFRPLAGLEGLTFLELAGVSEPFDSAVVSGLLGLTELVLTDPPREQRLAQLVGLDELTSLTLKSAGDVDGLGALAQLPRLRSLTLSRLWVKNLKPLAKLSALTELRLDDVGGVADLEPLGRLSQLRSLAVVSVFLERLVPGSLDVKAVGTLPELSSLELVERIEGVFVGLSTALGSLARLRSLKLDVDLRSEDLTAISRLRDLNELTLSAPNFPDLGPLASLVRLEQVTLVGDAFYDGRTGFPNLREISSLPRLTSLTLEMFEGYEVLGGVANFWQITTLRLRDILLRVPEGLWPLTQLKSLRTLELSRISRLDRDLHPLAELPALSELTLRAAHGPDDWDTSPLSGTVALV